MRISKDFNRLILGIPVWSIYLMGFIPAAVLIHGAYYDHLGPDPLKVLEHQLGESALIFLMIVLSINPLKKFFGLNLTKFRRSVGLLSFWYATLHVLTYLVLDQQLMLDLIIKDLTKRPYIIVGAIAFFVLIPLALTSNSWSLRWLGLKRWKNLHIFVYLSTFLGCTHYLMLVKSWPIEPLIYFAFVVFLIILRWFPKKASKDN